MQINYFFLTHYVTRTLGSAHAESKKNFVERELKLKNHNITSILW